MEFNANGDLTALRKTKNPASLQGFLLHMAERTGLEPATSGVTGQHSNQLNYRSQIFPVAPKPSLEASNATVQLGVPTGIRTPVSTVKGWCPRPLDDGDV